MKVAWETQYFMIPFVAPAWRAQWDKSEEVVLKAGFHFGSTKVTLRECVTLSSSSCLRRGI
jgi:hypothetical protein